MSSGMDSSILDTYLYEENNLLDQLDEMLVADEKNGDFSADDVNEIFRIMHKPADRLCLCMTLSVFFRKP